MATRRYPPTPRAIPTTEKFTVWGIHRGAWFGVRSFQTIDEAREFAREVLRGGVLITSERTTHTITAQETI